MKCARDSGSRTSNLKTSFSEQVLPSALDSRAAAGYLGCSEATLRLWRAQGRGPKWFHVGRLVKYRKTDLDEWTERHAVQPEAT